MIGRPLREWLAVDAAACAQRLLGATLVRVLPTGERLAGVVVETEAYLGAHDRASHTFGGRRTARNGSMYAIAGTSYVYFTYGMHHCMNIVCGAADEGTAVLLRAVEPVEGLETMRTNRRASSTKAALRDTDLCSGPAKLCAAMVIDRALDGVDLLTSSVLFLELDPTRLEAALKAGFDRSARVGVASAGPEWASAPLRFSLRGSRFVSRPGPTRGVRAAGL